MLKGKHILLGVTGSIAAYKAASIIRLLVKHGAEVKVVMTPLAKEFITPLTLATLSKNPILIDFFNPENGDWNSHIDLGLWADAYLIAPASANTIAKMSNGVADNLLLTTYLSVRCPVFIAPAMDVDMLLHPATNSNIEKLKSTGVTVIEPATGELASGLEGKGRMEEPEKIVDVLDVFFSKQLKLKGYKVLVTAGPTYEAIDPVRFIGNHSSGKMGYALAENLAKWGAEVVLVSGPVSISLDLPNVAIIKVDSAEEMYKACIDEFPKCNAAIMAAAVADYSPVKTSASKIKRSDKNITLQLKANPDIAASIGKMKKKKQVVGGFALETDDPVMNATRKLKKKNLDFIVLNSLNDPGAGFNSDTNKITIIDRNNKIENFELKSKAEVAVDIIYKLCEFLKV
jgi:phosphopantothenoylcysteine decarboxylase / phosphopantothenate---cysteine ligase